MDAAIASPSADTSAAASPGVIDAQRPADLSPTSTSDASMARDAGRLEGADVASDTDASKASDAAADANSGMGFPPVRELGAKGPFATNNVDGESEGPDCSIHRPAKLGEGGLRHPVVIWGMGTGGFNTYQESFDLWASHGFIVAAALLGDGQGDGAEMLACLTYVCEHYAANVDCRAGATGHSQGGAGGSDSRVVTTAPIQPYTAQGFGGFDQASFTRQRGPMLLLSGTADVIATPSQHQQPVFAMTNVPVVWATLVDGEHVTTGLDGAAGYRKVVLAWFRLQLMGDQSFRSMFYGPDCTLCKDAMWMVQRRGIN
jgi:hypothetical protein